MGTVKFQVSCCFIVEEYLSSNHVAVLDTNLIWGLFISNSFSKRFEVFREHLSSCFIYFKPDTIKILWVSTKNSSKHFCVSSDKVHVLRVKFIFRRFDNLNDLIHLLQVSTYRIVVKNVAGHCNLRALFHQLPNATCAQQLHFRNEGKLTIEYGYHPHNPLLVLEIIRAFCFSYLFPQIYYSKPSSNNCHQTTGITSTCAYPLPPMMLGRRLNGYSTFGNSSCPVRNNRGSVKCCNQRRSDTSGGKRQKVFPIKLGHGKDLTDSFRPVRYNDNFALMHASVERCAL